MAIFVFRCEVRRTGVPLKRTERGFRPDPASNNPLGFQQSDIQRVDASQRVETPQAGHAATHDHHVLAFRLAIGGDVVFNTRCLVVFSRSRRHRVDHEYAVAFAG